MTRTRSVASIAGSSCEAFALSSVHLRREDSHIRIEEEELLMNPNEEIVDQYDSSVGIYRDLTEKLAALIADILEEQNVNVHSVTSRVKSRDSLLKKISRPNSSYTALTDITDVAGIRITTFFADDVDRVAEMIEREFDIDSAHSIDKRATLDPDRFGYLSLHHVISFSQERCSLVEYRRFRGLKSEIQTRSILQHAWAEIEHDLGYKAASSVPNEIRRRFSRLAGLLELADQEFAAIRKQLTIYEKTVGEKIRISPQSVELNKASLDAFVTNSEVVRRLDSTIAGIDGGTVRESVESSNIPRSWENEIRGLHAVGIASIADLDRELNDREQLIAAFAANLLGGDKQARPFAQGVSIAYLIYVLVAQTGDKDEVLHFLDISGLRGVSWESILDRILESYSSIGSSS